MSVEGFLIFWSRYNTLIIEVLIAVILLTVVYLAFRAFFGDESPRTQSQGMDAEGLEKALQKILTQTGTSSPSAPASSAPSAPAATAAPAMAAAPAVLSPEKAEEIAKLKGEIVEQNRLIDELRVKSAAAAAAGSTGSAAPAVSDEERRKQEAYVKNLEARLAEYEIISEDIADLSFYKEENSKLHKEIETLRGSGAPALDAAPPSVAMDAANGLTTAPPEVAPPVETAKPPEASTEEVLKELADAASAPVPPPTKADDGALINQFEDFMKKG